MKTSCSLILLALSVGPFGCNTEESGTGNTNWRVECATSDDCPSDLVCGCSRCGPSCDGTLECRDDENPLCVANEPSGGADDDVGSSPNDGGTSPAGDALDCNRFTGGIQTPVDVQTTFEVVPGENATTSGIDTAADDSGVYWQTLEGAVYGVPTGASEATLLREAPADYDPLTQVTGFLSSRETLYWMTGVGADPSFVVEPGPPSPPYRLYALPKLGGEAQLLAEFQDFASIVVAVDSGVVVSWPYSSPAGRLALISLEGEVREQEQMPGYSGTYRTLGQEVFFAETSESGGTFFRASMPDGSPEVVATLGATTAATVMSEFVVAPGMALWVSSETQLDPLVQADTFHSVDFGTNCVQTLPSVGLSVGQTLIDEHHVYWHSFNGLGGVSSDEPFPGMDVLRVNLQSGALERLVVDGFEPTLVDDFVTQTDSLIYVSRNSDGALLALRKPE